LEPQPCGDSWDLTYSISRQQCATIGTSKAPQSWEGEVFVAVFAAMLVIVCVLNRLLQYYWASALRTKLDKSVSKLNQKLIKLVATGEGNLDVIGGGTNTNANVTDSFKPFPVRDGIMFSYKDLTLTVNAGGQPKVVVDRVSGEVPAATMTAVMGPSGAGKTSFMNVLCDRAG
jgi:ABC-type multidrug transport system fused ATPase/permease subunit